MKTVCMALMAALGGCQIFSYGDRATPEQMARATMLNVLWAEVRYEKWFGRYGTLKDLVTHGQLDLNPELASSGRVAGYAFHLTIREAGFSLVAMPTKPPLDGQRRLYSDQTRVIRETYYPDVPNHNSRVVIDPG